LAVLKTCSIFALHRETEAGSAEEQPVRDSGVHIRSKALLWRFGNYLFNKLQGRVILLRGNPAFIL